MQRAKEPSFAQGRLRASIPARDADGRGRRPFLVVGNQFNSKSVQINDQFSIRKFDLNLGQRLGYGVGFLQFGGGEGGGQGDHFHAGGVGGDDSGGGILDDQTFGGGQGKQCGTFEVRLGIRLALSYVFGGNQHFG